MHYFTFADKDTTLYQASSSMNTGLDEILEVRKEVSDTGATVNVSRVLMRFDLTYISASIVRGTITNPSFYLNLYDAHPTSLATSQSLYAYPISGSWIMGDGRSYDNPVTTEGASWLYRYGKVNGRLDIGDTGSFIDDLQLIEDDETREACVEIKRICDEKKVKVVFYKD